MAPDLTIPGVSGGISTENSLWSGPKFSVDGQRVRAHGFPRNRLTLPGISGPVEAKVKGGLIRAHPVLVVDGKEYPTGPPTPMGLQILALLPLLTLILLQGAVGFLVAFGAVAINMGIVREERSNGAKVGFMTAILIAAVLIDIAIVAAIT